MRVTALSSSSRNFAHAYLAGHHVTHRMDLKRRSTSQKVHTESFAKYLKINNLKCWRGGS
jgi:hypothetical protein